MTDTQFRLDATQVEEIFNQCLADVANDGPVIDAIAEQVVFNQEALEKHRDLIIQMLMELPTEFRTSGGGGWSFLNACNDRHGNQWTGLHQTMAHLFALGQGIGMVESQLPRALWSVLPAGMPYYTIKDQ